MCKILKLYYQEFFLISSEKTILLTYIVKYVFTKLNIDIAKIKINSKLFIQNKIIDIFGDNTKIKPAFNIEINNYFYKTKDKLIKLQQLN